MAKRIVGKQSSKETPIRKRLRTKQSVAASGTAASARPAGSPIAAAASKYDDILRKIYYDIKEGFGSIVDTWKAAKNKTLK